MLNVFSTQIMGKKKASDRFTVLAFSSLCWARTSDPLINSQML